ncbi:unnamed protein product [Notodromas monacha]|uniref:CYTH domain-containing protein n=1 Tax=Notodromas monacha TaxID=399045 RepID=A0A7R9BQL6_9CRUS|nr:unnamed protein product [Notodromas monacha]CAG0918514.1 unnamed protein product [Notodromas monacha]
MRNVEIKARVNDLEQLLKTAEELAGSPCSEIEQHDTFFFSNEGRLKLRVELVNGIRDAKLIFYDRPDESGAKLSNYSISPVSDPSALKHVLSNSLGIKDELVKMRKVFMVGQTRVHVDHIPNHGHFMELEVVLSDHQNAEDGQAEAERLMEQLNIRKEDLLSGAYVDFLKVPAGTVSTATKE